MILPKDTVFKDSVLKMTLQKKVDDKLLVLQNIHQEYLKQAKRPVKNILDSDVDSLIKSLISENVLKLELDIEQLLHLEKKTNYAKSLLHDVAFIKDERSEISFTMFEIHKNKYRVNNDEYDSFIKNKLYQTISNSKDIKTYNKLQSAIDYILQELPRSKREYSNLIKALRVIDTNTNKISYNGFYSINSKRN